MEKLKKILLLVLAFALVFSASTMNIAQASSSKLDLIANKTIELDEEKFKLDERFIKPENPTENVRIIVELEGTPAIDFATQKGVRYKDLAVKERQKFEGQIEKDQVSIQSQIKKEVPTIKYLESFTTVFNGFSAEVLAGEIEGIAELDGVKAVYESTEYKRPETKPEMVYSKELVQAQSVWNNYKYKGEGMIVGVIDSGIDPSHRDMVLTDSNSGSLTKDYISEKLADGTITNGQYFTPKVPFGYNYMDGNNEIVDLGPTASMHGMHVSGTVGANGNEENGGIKGVAPEAQLLALKVFGNDPGYGSTYGDIYVKAIDDSIKLGADVLNLSLGAPAGFVESESPEQKAVQNATDNGILVTISAGNSDMFNSGQPLSALNQDYGVTGSPSVSSSSLGVASIENSQLTSYAFDYYIDGEFVDSGLYSLANNADPRKLFTGRQQVSFGGYGTEAEFNKDEVKGKIALVSRGNGVNFVDKGLNAQKLGATGVIVYNNAAGIISMASDDNIVIPYMSSLKDDGDIMAAALKEGKKVEVEFKGSFATVPNPETGAMSTFTSWGPTPNLDFKPEITAPGGNIFSTLNNNEYGIMNGTSMAAPHVAGGAALLLQRVDNDFGLKGKDRVQLARTLLMNTAIPVETVPGVYESPRRQGAGLMQIANAIETEVYVQDKATGEPKVALKEIKDNKFTLTLDVTNVSNEEKTYDVNLQLQSDVPLNTGSAYVTYSDYYESYVYVEGTDEESDYTADYDSSITIPANSTKTLTIEVDITASEGLYKYFKNGYFVDGFVTLTDSTDTNVPLVVPFFGYNGKWDQAPIFDKFRWETGKVYSYTSLIDEEGYFITGGDTNNPARFGFSPNGDGVQDAVMPLFSLTRNAKELKAEVTDKDGKVLRKLGSLSYLRKNYSASSPVVYSESLMWDGKINGKLAADGQYNIKLSAVIDFEGANWQSIVFPVKIDTVAPTAEIKFNEKTKTLSFKDIKDNEGGTGYYYTVILVNGKEHGELKGETYALPEVKNKDVITVEIYDAAGNFSTQNFRTAIPETEKPVIYIDSPEYDERFNSSTVTVTGRVEDSSLIRSVTVNGEIATLKGSEFSHILTLEDGFKDIRVEATDEFSNKIEITRKIFVDTTAPTLTVKEYAAKTSTETEKTPITINVQDNFDKISVFVNDSEVFKKEQSEPYGLKEFNQDITFDVELELGENKFEIVAKDLGGNPTKQTVTIVRGEDTTPPDNSPKGNIDTTVENLLNGETIIVDLKDLKGDNNTVIASLSTKVLKTLVETEKPLTLVVDGTTITIPAAVLAQISSTVKGEGVVSVSIGLNGTFETTTGDQLTNVIDLKITSKVDETEETISQFNEKVIVSLPLPEGVKDLTKVASYYIDEKAGALTYVQSKVVDGNIVFKTSHFSKFAVLEQNVTFKDLSGYKWATEYIESLASKTIIKGKSKDKFAPGTQITREEFAVLLVRALDIPTTSYEGVFSDVTEKNTWSVLEIEAANRAGIVLGDNGKFNPKANITREQMVTMIIRALDYDSPSALKDVKTEVAYKDASKISNYAKESVGYATNLGIINGISSKDGIVFEPKKNANRAEAAKMIYLLLENLK